MIGGSKTDERVVQMTFDNKEFEQGVSQSRQTLKDLDSTLNNMGGAEGLKNIGKAASDVNPNLENIGNAVESLQKRFSTLGIIGMRALENITDKVMGAMGKVTSFVTEGVVQGGIKRAMNLEQAQFQLEGMGVKWAEISDDISYAVDNTAYSLDEAAKAAAVFSASGVQTGQDMKVVLRSVSGIAAMTGDTYSNIADVMTKIAGQGRVMGDDLNRLATRGLNAAAIVGRVIGATEQDVRAMVKAGELDFKSFASIMYNEYGEQATKANETFTGALSNMKAALARIGAKVATPALTNLRDIFNALRPKINEASEALNPFIDGINGLQDVLSKKLVKTLNAVDFSRFVEFSENVDWYLVLQNIFEAFARIGERIKPIFQAFSDVFFNASHGASLQDFTERLADFLGSLKMTDIAAQGLRSTFRGLFSILHLGFAIFTQFMRGLEPIGKLLGFTETGIFAVTGTLGDFIFEADQFVTSSDIIYKSVKNLSEYLIMIPNRVMTAARTFDDALKKYTGVSLFDEFDKLQNYIFSIQSNIFNTLSGAGYDYTRMNGFQVALTYIEIEADKLYQKLKPIEQWFNMIFGSKTLTWQQKIEMLGKVLEANVFKPVREFFKEKFNFSFTFDDFFDGVRGLREMLEDSRENATGFKAILIDAALKVLDFFDKHEEGIRNAASNIKNNLIKLKDAIVEFFQDMTLEKAIRYGVTALLVYYLAKHAFELGSAVMSFKMHLKGLLGALTMFFRAKAMNEGLKTVRTLTNLIMALAGAVVLLSVIPEDKLKNAVDSVGALLVIAGSIMVIIAAINKKVGPSASMNVKLFNDTAQKIVAFGLAMVGIATALVALIPVVKVFSKMSDDEWVKGFGAVAAIIAEMGLLVWSIGLLGNIPGAGKKMVAAGALMNMMATALDAMIPVILVMANIDGKSKGWEKWSKALLGVLALVIEIAAPVVIIGKFGERSGKQIIAAGLTMTLMATALNQMIPVIAILGNMSLDQLVQGGAAAGILAAVMSTLVAVFAGFGSRTGKQVVAAGIMMNELGLAIWTLIPPIIVFGNLPFNVLLQGGLAVAAALFAIAGAGKLASGAVPGLGAIALVLAGLGAVIASVGVAVAGVGAGILLFVKAVGEMAELSSEQAKQSAQNFLDFFTTIFSGLGDLATAMENSADDLLRIFAVVIGTLLDAVTLSAGKFAEAALQIIVAVLEALDAHAAEILELIVDILEKAIKVVLGFDADFGDAGDSLFNAFIDKLLNKTEADTKTKEWVQGIVDGIVKYFKVLTDTISGKALLQTIFSDDHQSDASKIIAGELTKPFEEGKSPVFEGGAKHWSKSIEDSYKAAATETKEKLKETAKEVPKGMGEGFSEGMVTVEEETHTMIVNSAHEPVDTYVEELHQTATGAIEKVKTDAKSLGEAYDKKMAEVAQPTSEKTKQSAKEMVETAGEGVKEGAEKVGKDAKEAVDAVNTSIEESVSQIGTDTFSNMFSSLTESVDKDALFGQLSGFMDPLMEQFNEYASELMNESGTGMLDTLGQSLGEYDMSATLQSLEDSITTNFDSLPTDFSDIANLTGTEFNDTLASFGTPFNITTTGLHDESVEGISDDQKKEFAKKCKSMVEAGLSEMEKLKPKFKAMGQTYKSQFIGGFGDIAAEMAKLANDAVDGFIKQLEARASEVAAAAAKITAAATAGGAKGQDSASPSKKWMALAGDAADGYILGLKANTSRISDAAENMTSDAANYLSLAIHDIFDYLSDANLDEIEPTIRPVLDMSNVESGLTNMALTGGTLNVSSINAKARSISSRIAANNASLTGVTPDPQGTVTNMSFTQNNYSPRSLSRIDIYRQTKNLFAQMKGLVEG